VIDDFVPVSFYSHSSVVFEQFPSGMIQELMYLLEFLVCPFAWRFDFHTTVFV
jgi:hypothetical protein